MSYKTNSFSGILFAAFLVILCIPPAQAENKSNKDVYIHLGCPQCHGIDGKKTALSIYPKLAGQNKDYLVKQINDIRKNIRVVRGMLSSLEPNLQHPTHISADEIEAVAEYLSGIECK